MAVVTVALIVSAKTFASSIEGAGPSKPVTEAAVFTETVLEDISAQDCAVPGSLEGCELSSGDSKDTSKLRAELTVFQAAAGLRQIRLLLRGVREGQEPGHVTTQRANS